MSCSPVLAEFCGVCVCVHKCGQACEQSSLLVSLYLYKGQPQLQSDNLDGVSSVWGALWGGRLGRRGMLGLLPPFPCLSLMACYSYLVCCPGWKSGWGWASISAYDPPNLHLTMSYWSWKPLLKAIHIQVHRGCRKVTVIPLCNAMQLYTAGLAEQPKMWWLLSSSSARQTNRNNWKKYFKLVCTPFCLYEPGGEKSDQTLHCPNKKLQYSVSLYLDQWIFR